MTLFELYSLNICVNHKIKIWIYNIFNKHNVLYDYQFKFHTLYSIHIALITLIDKLLTHWGLVTHICIGTNTNIGSDNGLSPGRRQAIIWTNARLLLIEPLGTNFSEILIKIHTFSFKKMHLKMSGNGGHFVSVSMCYMLWTMEVRLSGCFLTSPRHLIDTIDHDILLLKL